MTKTEKAAVYQEANPDASIKQVKEAVGCCHQTVLRARKEVGHHSTPKDNHYVRAKKRHREERLAKLHALLQETPGLSYTQAISVMADQGVRVYPRDVAEVKGRLLADVRQPVYSDRSRWLTVKW
jgi:transposase-like protein